MRGRIEIDGPDLVLGIVALAVSAGYLNEASRIPESLLADVVGAAGVPTALGWAMAAIGLILCIRGVLCRAPVGRDAPAVASGHVSAALRPHLLALGMLAILVAYVVVVPRVGYVAATALLIGAVARFAGASFGRNLLLAAVAGGLVLWLLFDPVLGISLPIGSWWQGP